MLSEWAGEEREGEGGVVERRREAVVKAEAAGRRHKGRSVVPCQEAVGLVKKDRRGLNPFEASWLVFWGTACDSKAAGHEPVTRGFGDALAGSTPMELPIQCGRHIQEA